jgi:S-formylglutathione hydrolase FrmB
VIPFVEKRFRVLGAKDDRAIAGLSMGGGHTLAATNNNPGKFAYIGVFSSGPAALDEAFRKQLGAVKDGGVKFYWLGARTTDTARDRTVNLSQLVKTDGFNTPIARFRDGTTGSCGATSSHTTRKWHSRPNRNREYALVTCGP